MHIFVKIKAFLCRKIYDLNAEKRRIEVYPATAFCLTNFCLSY